MSECFWNEDEDPLPPPPVEVTPELFRKWRGALRLGRDNPEPMNNPVWEWLVRAVAVPAWPRS